MWNIFKRDKTNAFTTRQILTWLGAIWQKHRLQATLNTCIGVLIVLGRLAEVWATKLLIDTATQPHMGYTLQEAAALLIFFIIIDISLSVLHRWVKALLGVRAVNTMKRDLYTHLLRCEWTGLKQYHSGDLINRTEKDVTTVVSFITEEIPALVTTVVQFVGAFLFLYYMNQTLALLVAVIVPIFILISKLYLKRMRLLTHQVRTSESQIQAQLQESVQHRSVIKALSRSNMMIRRLRILQLSLQRHVLTQTKLSTITMTLMNVGFVTGYLTAFLWGVVSLQQGLITYGSLMAFIQLVAQIQQPARNMTRFVPKIITMLTASDRLMELYAVRTEPAAQPLEIPDQPIGIRLSHVSYAYTPTSRRILEDVSLQIPPGSCVAVVGETGVGKTTFIRLLLAFIQPTAGHISLFTPDVSLDVSPAVRANYAYVPQGNTLFSGTIAENLRLGNPTASEAQMYAALRAAHADFVWQLPDLLQSRCGEQGDGLSEGQAQRISIARALLHEGGLLLLDEATSALDTATEAAVIQGILASDRGQTIVCVTHRLSILSHCTHLVSITAEGVTCQALTPQ